MSIEITGCKLLTRHTKRVIQKYLFILLVCLFQFRNGSFFCSLKEETAACNCYCKGPLFGTFFKLKKERRKKKNNSKWNVKRSDSDEFSNRHFVICQTCIYCLFVILLNSKRDQNFGIITDHHQSNIKVLMNARRDDPIPWP